LVKRDLLSIADLSSEEVMKVLNSGKELKGGARSDCLAGRSVAMLFEKPSLRTRVSFDLAVHQLGGHPIYLGPDEVGLGGREMVSDVARVLSRYVDAIVARTYAHKTLQSRYPTSQLGNDAIPPSPYALRQTTGLFGL